MSIPHILTGTSAQHTLPPINSKHFSSSNSKEHIRERLNMHVKKRIHGQDIIPHPQYSLPSSSVYSNTPLSSALKHQASTHPFLMSSELWFRFFDFKSKKSPFKLMEHWIISHPLYVHVFVLIYSRCFRDNATDGCVCQLTHNCDIRLQ